MVAGALLWFFNEYPRVGPPPDLRVDVTPERLERGAYLAEHVCMCLDCHSERDWSRFSGPTKPGTEGCGGEAFPLPFGTLYAPNLTQLQDWTDGELYRAIAEGVTRDGGSLFPIMPYPRYGHLTDEDVYSIIAYVRHLKPIAKTVPPTVLQFPMSVIVRTMPQAASPWPADTERGKYLVNAAACADCHTPQVQGKPVPGRELAGGFEFSLPTGGKVVSTNLTTLQSWKEADFLLLFRAKAGVPTVMPWEAYGGMTDEDLTAIFHYLQSLPPVKD